MAAILKIYFSLLLLNLKACPIKRNLLEYTRDNDTQVSELIEKEQFIQNLGIFLSWNWLLVILV